MLIAAVLTDISLTKVASGFGNATPSIRPSELKERERESKQLLNSRKFLLYLPGKKKLIRR